MASDKTREDLEKKFIEFLSEVQAGPLYCMRCGGNGPEIMVRRVYTLNGTSSEVVVALHPECEKR